jgi:hypothetical protein
VVDGELGIVVPEAGAILGVVAVHAAQFLHCPTEGSAFELQAGARIDPKKARRRREVQEAHGAEQNSNV